jgi:hypothetical protein
MHSLMFFDGDTGDNGDNIYNHLKTRLIGFLRLVPGAQSTTGDTGDKIGVCPRLSPVKKGRLGTNFKHASGMESAGLHECPRCPRLSPPKRSNADSNPNFCVGSRTRFMEASP